MLSRKVILNPRLKRWLKLGREVRRRRRRVIWPIHGIREKVDEFGGRLLSGRFSEFVRFAVVVIASMRCLITDVFLDLLVMLVRLEGFGRFARRFLPNQSRTQ